MWDESDSYAHTHKKKNTQECKPKKDTCVGSDQQYVSTKQTVHFRSEKATSKREKNKHRDQYGMNHVGDSMLPVGATGQKSLNHQERGREPLSKYCFSTSFI